MFRPIYRKVHHKRESFSYNEALTGHTYHDFSEIADFIKVNEVKETTKVLANTSFKEHLLSMPQNQSFYIDVADEPFCKAVFTDNKAYVYEDGSIGREVKILYFYPSDNKSRTKQNHTTKQVKRTRKSRQNFEKARTHIYTVPKSMENKNAGAINGLSQISSYLTHERKITKPSSIRRLSQISSDPFYFFDQKESIRNIQLIKGQNNHVSRGHNVVNKKVLFTKYHKDTHKYSQVEILIIFVKVIKFCINTFLIL